MLSPGGSSVTLCYNSASAGSFGPLAGWAANSGRKRPGACTINILTAVIYEFGIQVRVFVSDRNLSLV